MILPGAIGWAFDCPQRAPHCQTDQCWAIGSQQKRVTWEHILFNSQVLLSGFFYWMVNSALLVKSKILTSSLPFCVLYCQFMGTFRQSALYNSWGASVLSWSRVWRGLSARIVHSEWRELILVGGGVNLSTPLFMSVQQALLTWFLLWPNFKHLWGSIRYDNTGGLDTVFCQLW